MRFAYPALALAALLVGCSSHSDPSHPMPAEAHAVAHLIPSESARTGDGPFSKVSGEITFVQRGDETLVLALIHGLPPNAQFGFHIHEKADLSAPDLKSAGPHWDPSGTAHHGALGDAHSHAGDMGNVMSDANGFAKVNFRTHAFTVTGEPSVIGHSVILHAKSDDFSTQPSGASGDRIAGGIIWAKK